MKLLPDTRDNFRKAFSSTARLSANNKYSLLAERSGIGLQNLLRRFDPVHDLREKLNLTAVVRVYFNTPLYYLDNCVLLAVPFSFNYFVE